MPRRQTRKKVVKRPIATVCYFCETGKTPDYLEIPEIAKFVTERARLLGRSRSGLCAKHQRRVAQAIKRARHLGLLPFRPSL